MNITFCINTTKDERDHIELLFKSLYANLSNRNHNIIVYIETCGNGNVEFLVSQKKHFPNLTIIKNPLPVPIGYGRNINLMFEMATTEVVSYLQSDMVISPNYDIDILRNLTESTVVSSTRIEPPLHTPSSEKITHNFGLDPATFDLDEFSKLSNNAKQDKISDYWFAPFTIYKKTWLSIGGHDTIFRRSREDSDLLYRFSIAKIKTIQDWNAIVYHFTCTSSRGKEWWKQANHDRTHTQSLADQVEMMKFLQKWPGFKHSSTFDPLKEYKYNISANIFNTSESDVMKILQSYYKFNKIYIDNIVVRDKVKEEFGKLQNFANTLCNFSPEQWLEYKKYYRTIDSDDIFIDGDLIDDVIVNIDLKTTNLENNVAIQSLNDIIHENRSEVGTFECDGIIITINKAINNILDNLHAKNPPISDIEFEIL